MKENSIPKKEDLEEYKRFSHLAGIEIWTSQAARKYDIHHQNLSRWAKAGYIRIIRNDQYKTFLDEQDVAYCAAIYKEQGSAGRKIFASDGTPIRARFKRGCEEKIRYSVYSNPESIAKFAKKHLSSDEIKELKKLLS